jgi:protein phosphatase
MGRYVSAGTSDAGNVRGNNEDRVYIDESRGIYLVVDGMGGQAAGEEAAEIAVKTIRGRLERQTETSEQRVREAIALANNAIYEAASGNSAWHGMACVLTLALVEDGHAVLGHVGDSRA